MSGHSILIRVDRDCMHRELVGRAEDADGDFLEKDETVCVSYAESIGYRTYPTVCNKYFC